MYGNVSFADGCVLVGFDDGNSSLWGSCNSDRGSPFISKAFVMCTSSEVCSIIFDDSLLALNYNR